MCRSLATINLNDKSIQTPIIKSFHTFNHINNFGIFSLLGFGLLNYGERIDIGSFQTKVHVRVESDDIVFDVVELKK